MRSCNTRHDSGSRNQVLGVSTYIIIYWKIYYLRNITYYIKFIINFVNFLFQFSECLRACWNTNLMAWHDSNKGHEEPCLISFNKAENLLNQGVKCSTFSHPRETTSSFFISELRQRWRDVTSKKKEKKKQPYSCLAFSNVRLYCWISPVHHLLYSNIYYYIYYCIKIY